MTRAMLVVGMAAIVGCAFSKEQYRAKEAEVAKYQQSTQEQNARASALESKITSLQQQNETLQSQNETLQSEAADLESKLNQSSAETAKLERRTPLKVNELVLFKENSSTLTPEGKRTLDAVAEALAASKDKAVMVSGFTDDAEGAGKDPKAKRWQLSSARAVAVAKYLTSRGVDPALIAVAGFGEARAVAPNDSIANRAMNRRVEIMLTPVNQDMLTIDVKPAELMQSGAGHGQGQ